MQLNDAMIDQVAQRLAALADPARIRALLRLKAGPANVSQLTAHLGLAQPSVSKHLATLRQAGLVTARRVGQQAVYSVTDRSIFDLCEIVCASVARHIRQQALALEPAKGHARTQRDRSHPHARNAKRRRARAGSFSGANP